MDQLFLSIWEERWGPRRSKRKTLWLCVLFQCRLRCQRRFMKALIRLERNRTRSRFHQPLSHATRRNPQQIRNPRCRHPAIKSPKRATGTWRKPSKLWVKSTYLLVDHLNIFNVAVTKTLRELNQTWLSMRISHIPVMDLKNVLIHGRK